MNDNKMHVSLIVALILALIASLAVGAGSPGVEPPAPNAPLGTAFTYQGRLTDDAGLPVDGTCDFEFSLWNDPDGGAQFGLTWPVDGVAVTKGLFTVTLDFGDVFHIDALWLQVAVRCAGDPGYTDLSPRQALTAAPFALAMPGRWTQVSASPPNLLGGYSGNTVADGVAGATIGGGGHSTWPNRVFDSFGTVSGGSGNEAGVPPIGAEGTARYATAGGGEENRAGSRSSLGSTEYATVGGGRLNNASGAFSTIAGGEENQAGNEVYPGLTPYSTIGGGYMNASRDQATTVAGGQQNQAGIEGCSPGESSFATVGGGRGNIASHMGCTVAGGEYNLAGSADYTDVTAYATVGGGFINTASEVYATVSGGYSNTASFNGATIGGGSSNRASGSYATVPGGSFNTASGSYSFAAGRRAKATSQGCFTWGDSNDADVTCNINNRWVARASGGFYLYTSGNLASGAYLATGSGTWADLSDRNLKANLAPVDGRQVLARLAEVPIATWNYTTQDASVRHMGPTAQDFYGAFGLGDDETHIATVDADGVAMAAIQGLYAENQALKAEIDALEARLSALEQAEGAPGGKAGHQPNPLWLLSGGLLLAGVVAIQHRRRGRL